MKHIKDFLEDRFLNTEIPWKNEFKHMITKELNSIKNKLLDLLDHNDRTTEELEKLDRDEFVIDIQKKDEMMSKGD